MLNRPGYVELCTCKQSPSPPLGVREPECEHDTSRERGRRNPASACVECRDGHALREWKNSWAAYWAAHSGPGHTAIPPTD